MRHESGLLPLLWILVIVAGGICLLLYDITLLTYVIVGIGILLLAGALFVMFYSGYWVTRNRFSRTVRVQARVVRRRKKDWDVSIVGNTPTGLAARLGMLGNHRSDAWRAYSREMAKGDVPEITLAQGSDFFVTFQVGGREMELCVPEDYYVKCGEGAEGLLVYRGEEFMHFILGVP